MYKLDKTQIFIIFVVSFYILHFFITPASIAFDLGYINVINIFGLLGLIELLIYIKMKYSFLKSLIYISICNTIIGTIYFKITYAFLDFYYKLPETHSCKCDYEYLGQNIKLYKYTSEWLQYITLLLLFSIILKYFVFRIIYFYGYNEVIRTFKIFNVTILILYLIFSGYFSLLYKCVDIYYRNKLYLNDTYYRIYCHCNSIDEPSIADSKKFEEQYLKTNWAYKSIYSKPNNYFSKFLVLPRFSC